MSRVTIDLSSLILPADCGIIRNPTRDAALRHADFWDRYDADTVIFDLFRTQDPGTLLAICPPLHNLRDDLDLRFRAEPSGLPCPYRKVTRISVDRLYIEVPPGTEHIVAETTIGEFPLTPRPDMTETFRDKRVAFTLSKDNDLVWIRDWAAYYARVHGVDAVVVYDNGSTRYGKAELEAALATVPELAAFAVIDWPFRYGPADYRRDLTIGFVDCDYCQRGSMEHAATRLLGKAAGVINVDIDELIYSASDVGLFEALDASATGYLLIDGIWVEAAHDGAAPEVRHAAYFNCVDTDEPEKQVSKWVIDPRRMRQHVQWQVHEVHLAQAAFESIGFSFGHFRAINTNWDLHQHATGTVLRTEGPGQAKLKEIPPLRDALRRAFPDRAEGMIRTAAMPQRADSLVRSISTYAHTLKEQAEQASSSASYWNQMARLVRSQDEENVDLYLEKSSRAVAVAPGCVEFRAAHVGRLFRAGRCEDALALVLSAPSAGNDHDRARLLAIEAFARLHAGEPLAIGAIDKAIAIRPHKPGYHYLRAKICEAAGDSPGAEASYQEAMRLADTDLAMAAHIEDIATRCYVSGHIEFHDFPISAENPRPEQPWRSYVGFLRRARRAAEAVKAARVLVERTALYPESHLLLVECLENTGDDALLGKARDAFVALTNDLLSRGPVSLCSDVERARTRTSYLPLRAAKHMFVGEVEEAAALAVELARLPVPKVNEARSIARNLVSRGEAGAAKTVIRALLDSVPGDHRAQNLYCEILKSLGDIAGLRAAVDEIAATEPAAGQPWSTLGLALRENGQRDEALAAFAEAVRREPSEIRFHMQRIWTLMGADEVEAALQASRDVVARFPEDHRGHLALAKALNRTGARAEALAAARRVLELKPDLDEARQLAEQLSDAAGSAPQAMNSRFFQIAQQ